MARTEGAVTLPGDNEYLDVISFKPIKGYYQHICKQCYKIFYSDSPFVRFCKPECRIRFYKILRRHKTENWGGFGKECECGKVLADSNITGLCQQCYRKMNNFGRLQPKPKYSLFKKEPSLMCGSRNDNELMDAINIGFENYGLHPKCQTCINRGKKCKRGTYAAPDAFFWCANRRAG